MNPAKHDPPAWVSSLEVMRVGERFEVRSDVLLATSGDESFTSCDALTRGDWSVPPRDPADPAAGYDVLDARGEALAFFALRDGRAEIHGPSLDTEAEVAATMTFTWFGRDVLLIRPMPTGFAVAVPDRRLDLRVVTAFVVVLARVMGSGA